MVMKVRNNYYLENVLNYLLVVFITLMQLCKFKKKLIIT